MRSIILYTCFIALFRLTEARLALLPRSLQSPLVETRNSRRRSPTHSALDKLRGGGTGDGGVDIDNLVDDTFGWASNLGAPAALVAGAVIGNLYDNIRSGELCLQVSDSKLVRFVKKVTRFLLLTAFTLQIMCIFVTTVTGTMLLGRRVELTALVTETTTPLAFFHDNFEFEYLTARITFLQGLLNWLLAIALTHALPTMEESTEVNYLNNFIAYFIFSIVAVMMSFYNQHMTFYPNYFAMVRRWYVILWTTYITKWPPLPMRFVTVPLVATTIYWGWRAFTDLDVKKEKK